MRAHRFADPGDLPALKGLNFRPDVVRPLRGGVGLGGFRLPRVGTRGYCCFATVVAIPGLRGGGGSWRSGRQLTQKLYGGGFRGFAQPDVLFVPFGISQGLLFQIVFEGLGQIGAGLISQAYKHKKHIGEFIGQICVLVGLFFRLFAVAACHDAGNFAHFFHQDGGISQLVEVAHSGGVDPPVYLLLCI